MLHLKNKEKKQSLSLRQIKIDEKSLRINAIESSEPILKHLKHSHSFNSKKKCVKTIEMLTKEQIIRLISK